MRVVVNLHPGHQSTNFKSLFSSYIVRNIGGSDDYIAMNIPDEVYDLLISHQSVSVCRIDNIPKVSYG